MTRALLIAMLLLFQDPKPEDAGNVRFVRPKGWERFDDKERGLTWLYPPGVPKDKACLIGIGTSLELKSKPREHFDEMWKNTIAGSEIVSGGDVTTDSKRGYEVLAAEATLKHPNGSQYHVALWLAVPGKRIQSVVFIASDEDYRAQGQRALKPMIESVEFLSLKAGTAKPGDAKPAATKPLELERALWGLKIVASTSCFLWVFKNGIATREWQQEGYDGFDVDKAAAEDTNWNYGKWTKDGDNYTVAFSADYRVLYARNGKTWDGYGAIFVPVLSLDDALLEGRFERDMSPSPNMGIRFKKDGTFSEDGVIRTAASLKEPRPPENGGTGKYGFRNFTLHLRYDDGSVVRIGMFVKEEEAKSPRTLFLNTYVLEKK